MPDKKQLFQELKGYKTESGESLDLIPKYKTYEDFDKALQDRGYRQKLHGYLSANDLLPDNAVSYVQFEKDIMGGIVSKSPEQPKKVVKEKEFTPKATDYKEGPLSPTAQSVQQSVGPKSDTSVMASKGEDVVEPDPVDYQGGPLSPQAQRAKQATEINPEYQEPTLRTHKEVYGLDKKSAEEEYTNLNKELDVLNDPNRFSKNTLTGRNKDLKRKKEVEDKLNKVTDYLGNYYNADRYDVVDPDLMTNVEISNGSPGASTYAKVKKEVLDNLNVLEKRTNDLNEKIATGIGLPKGTDIIGMYESLNKSQKSGEISPKNKELKDKLESDKDFQNLLSFANKQAEQKTYFESNFGTEKIIEDQTKLAQIRKDVQSKGGAYGTTEFIKDSGANVGLGLAEFVNAAERTIQELAVEYTGYMVPIGAKAKIHNLLKSGGKDKEATDFIIEDYQKEKILESRRRGDYMKPSDISMSPLEQNVEINGNRYIVEEGKIVGARDKDGFKIPDFTESMIKDAKAFEENPSNYKVSKTSDLKQRVRSTLSTGTQIVFDMAPTLVAGAVTGGSGLAIGAGSFAQMYAPIYNKGLEEFGDATKAAVYATALSTAMSYIEVSLGKLEQKFGQAVSGRLNPESYVADLDALSRRVAAGELPSSEFNVAAIKSFAKRTVEQLPDELKEEFLQQATEDVADIGTGIKDKANVDDYIETAILTPVAVLSVGSITAALNGDPFKSNIIAAIGKPNKFNEAVDNAVAKGDITKEQGNKTKAFINDIADKVSEYKGLADDKTISKLKDLHVDVAVEEERLKTAKTDLLRKKIQEKIDIAKGKISDIESKISTSESTAEQPTAEQPVAEQPVAEQPTANVSNDGVTDAVTDAVTDGVGGYKYIEAKGDDVQDVQLKGKEYQSETMSPDEYLQETGGYASTFIDQKKVDKIKEKIKNGVPLDPLTLTSKEGSNIGQEGRHRAEAAKQLGIKEIPVVRIEGELPKEGSVGIGGDVKAKNKAFEELVNLIPTTDLRRPNGSIGTQGFSPENLVEVARHIAKEMGFDIPAYDKNKGTSEIKQVIDYLKNNKEAQQKIRDYVVKDPVVVSLLPDNTYEIEDGNHRANLLNLIGVDVIPTIELNGRDKQTAINEHNSKVEAVEQSLKETTKAQAKVVATKEEAGGVGVGGDVEGFVGGTKIYRAGGKGRYFTTDKQYIQEGGFKGETREFEIPENTKLLDLREEDYKGILDLATEEERSILRKPQAKNSIEAKEQGNIVDAILKRNGYDGYIIKDAGETKDFDTVVFRKDKSPDLKAVEQSLKETPKVETVKQEIKKENEAKKADIERRRQEELDKAKKFKKGIPYPEEDAFVLQESPDGTKYRFPPMTNGVSKLQFFNNKGEWEYEKDPGSIVEKARESGYIVLRPYNVDSETSNKINAKYDAELEALKDTKTSEEVAKPSVEKQTKPIIVKAKSGSEYKRNGNGDWVSLKGTKATSPKLIKELDAQEELIIKQNDKKDKEGLPGEKQGGQPVVEAKSDKEASGEKAEAGGVLQEQEEVTKEIQTLANKKLKVGDVKKGDIVIWNGQEHTVTKVHSDKSFDLSNNAKKNSYVKEGVPTDEEFGGRVVEAVVKIKGKKEFISEENTKQENGKVKNELPNTLSQAEKQGSIRGGKNNARATSITAEVHRASEGDKTKGVIVFRRLIKEREQSALEKFAVENNLIVDTAVGEDIGGAEQSVYVSNNGSVVEKVNGNVDPDTSWNDLFHRIAVHNTLFPDVAYTLKGFTYKDGLFSAVFEQPFIKSGGDVKFSKVKSEMVKLGFRQLYPESTDPEKLFTFVNDKIGVIVKDLHGENVISGTDGVLHFIDPIIEFTEDRKSNPSKYENLQESTEAESKKQESIISKNDFDDIPFNEFDDIPFGEDETTKFSKEGESKETTYKDSSFEVKSTYSPELTKLIQEAEKSGNKAKAVALRFIKAILPTLRNAGIKLKIHPSNESMVAAQRKVNDFGSPTKGFYDPKTKELHLNFDKVTADTPIHEMLHPIIGVVFKAKPEIIKKWVDNIKSDPVIGKDLDEFIERYYGNDPPAMKQEELIVTYLGLRIAEILKTNPNIMSDTKTSGDKGIKSLYKKLIQSVKDLLNELGLGVYKKDIIGSIGDETNITDLALTIADVIGRSGVIKFNPTRGGNIKKQVKTDVDEETRFSKGDNKDNTLDNIYKKIEQDAKGIQQGTLIYERFSREEQEGIRRGGKILSEAALLTGAGSRTNQTNDQKNRRQEKSVEAYAKEKGIWVDKTNQTFNEKYKRRVGSGKEAIVWYKGNEKVLKTQNTYQYRTLQEKLDSIILHNAQFPVSALKVVGFGKNSQGDFQVIVEQQFFRSAKPLTQDQVDIYADSLGFTPTKNEEVLHNFQNDETLLRDFHEENVLRTKEGNLVVIDSIMRLNTPDLGYGGTREVGSEVKEAGSINNIQDGITNIPTILGINKLADSKGAPSGLLNSEQAKELQEEIESNYNDGSDPSKLIGAGNNDIRSSLFNYDNPLLEKDLNGVNLRIVDGLIEVNPSTGNRSKTYLLYADGQIVGKFYSAQEATDTIKFIEDRLIKNLDNNIRFSKESGALESYTNKVVQRALELHPEAKGDKKVVKDIANSIYKSLEGKGKNLTQDEKDYIAAKLNEAFGIEKPWVKRAKKNADDVFNQQTAKDVSDSLGIPYTNDYERNTWEGHIQNTIDAGLRDEGGNIANRVNENKTGVTLNEYFSMVIHWADITKSINRLYEIINSGLSTKDTANDLLLLEERLAYVQEALVTSRSFAGAILGSGSHILPLPAPRTAKQITEIYTKLAKAPMSPEIRTSLGRMAETLEKLEKEQRALLQQKQNEIDEQNKKIGELAARIAAKDIKNKKVAVTKVKTKKDLFAYGKELSESGILKSKDTDDTEDTTAKEKSKEDGRKNWLLAAIKVSLENGADHKNIDGIVEAVNNLITEMNKENGSNTKKTTKDEIISSLNNKSKKSVDSTINTVNNKFGALKRQAARLSSLQKGLENIVAQKGAVNLLSLNDLIEKIRKGSAEVYTNGNALSELFDSLNRIEKELRDYAESGDKVSVQKAITLTRDLLSNKSQSQKTEELKKEEEKIKSYKEKVDEYTKSHKGSNKDYVEGLMKILDENGISPIKRPTVYEEKVLAKAASIRKQKANLVRLAKEANRAANAGKLEKAKDVFKDIFSNLFRSLKVTSDLSAPLTNALLAEVKLISDAALEMDTEKLKIIQDAWSKAIKAAKAGLKNDGQIAQDYYDVIQQAGGDIFEHLYGLKLTHPFDPELSEEYFKSNLAAKMGTFLGDKVKANVVQASEAHMVTYLNQLRYHLFKAYYDANPSASKEELKNYAELINNLSGTSKDNVAEMAGNSANYLFLAFKYMYSRWKMLGSLASGDANRRNTAWQVVATMGILVTTIALLGGDFIDIDEEPTSNSFLKLRIGDQYIESIPGLTNIVRMFMHTAAVSANAYGVEMSNIRQSNAYFLGDKSNAVYEPFLKYIGGRLNPSIGVIKTALTGNDYLGRPYAPGYRGFLSAAGEQVSPITVGSIFETLTNALEQMSEETDQKIGGQVGIKNIPQHFFEIIGGNVTNYQNAIKDNRVVNVLEKLDYVLWSKVGVPNGSWVKGSKFFMNEYKDAFKHRLGLHILYNIEKGNKITHKTIDLAIEKLKNGNNVEGVLGVKSIESALREKWSRIYGKENLDAIISKYKGVDIRAKENKEAANELIYED